VSDIRIDIRHAAMEAIENGTLKDKPTLAKRLGEFLEHCSDVYYNTGAKVVSDCEYDTLRDGLREATRSSLPVGATPRSGMLTEEHDFPELVGTLDKRNVVFGEKSFHEWLFKAMTRAGVSRARMAGSLKRDGNSAVVTYLRGTPVSAVTRGKDGKGVDVLHLLPKHRISNPFAGDSKLGIKYEIIMRYTKLDALNEETGRGYVSPRSVVSGLLGSKEASEAAPYLSLAPLDYKLEEGAYTDDRGDRLEVLHTNSIGIEGCDVLPLEMLVFEGDAQEISEQLQFWYDECIKTRQDLDFMVDGLVLEFLDEDVREELGWTEDGSEPRWAMALKFPYMEQTTRARRFFLEIGNLGRATPMVEFDPVYFNGAKQTKCSLANWNRWDKLAPIGIGTEGLIEYRNDTLSYFVKLDLASNDLVEPFKFEERCPSCDTLFYFTHNKEGERVFAYCTNSHCPSVVVGKTVNFLEKMDVKLVKESTLRKLYDHHMLPAGIESLFSLDYEEVAVLNGLGKKSADVIRQAVESMKGCWDWQLLGSLGIDSIGRTLAKRLMKVYDLYDLLELMNAEDSADGTERAFVRTITATVEGFAESKSQKLYDGININWDLIVFLYEALEPKTYRDELSKAKTSGPSLNLVVTGSLKNWSSRDELKDKLDLLGHKMSDTVSAKTSYLVTNTPHSGTGKNKKAQELKVPIITEDELMAMLNL
jgi:DNA ligase (NAD+)